jgi:hypothetical protein
MVGKLDARLVARLVAQKGQLLAAVWVVQWVGEKAI